MISVLRPASRPASRPRARAASLTLAVLLPLGSAAALTPATTAATLATATAPTVAPAGMPRTAATTRVLAISVDALNPRAIRQLGRAGAPNFYRLKNEGASTFNARTAYEQTVTLPNHTGMVTGRRIDAALAGHGVTWNSDVPDTTVHQAAGGRVGSVFSVVHAAGRSTALFASKSKFSLFDRSWPRGIHRFRFDERNGPLVGATRRDLVAHQRAFTFLHLSAPDDVGHESGFMSPGYLDVVRRMDALLGRLLTTIEGDPALRQDLVVVLTSDHGGDGAHHSDATRLANYRVPFMVWGPGVARGGLYALNPDYADPGTGQPTYDGVQPVRNGAVANLATDLLGLPAVPGSEMNAGQDLDVG